jgi:hypothetical protein
MNKHTKAPWTARGDNGKYNWDHDWRVDDDSAATSEAVPIWADGQVIAFVVYSSNGYYRDTHPSIDANARLIAAAPDLLEALEAIVSCSDEDMQFRCQTPRDYEIKTLAQAALAKAKGEE